jgi:hypothetical protein
VLFVGDEVFGTMHGDGVITLGLLSTPNVMAEWLASDSYGKTFYTTEYSSLLGLLEMLFQRGWLM